MGVHRMWKYGKSSVLGIVTGMVAGLGTIAPASGFVGPVGGIVIDTCAGWVCFFATQVLKRVLKIDDSLDVSHVRGVCVYSELCSPRSSWTQASVTLATLLA
jgi:ammonia channel protein AmtB